MHVQTHLADIKVIHKGHELFDPYIVLRKDWCPRSAERCFHFRTVLRNQHRQLWIDAFQSTPGAIPYVASTGKRVTGWLGGR